MTAKARLAAWKAIIEEAEKLGAWEFADLCRDRYWEEHYRMGISNILRNN